MAFSFNPQNSNNPNQGFSFSLNPQQNGGNSNVPAIPPMPAPANPKSTFSFNQQGNTTPPVIPLETAIGGVQAPELPKTPTGNAAGALTGASAGTIAPPAQVPTSNVTGGNNGGGTSNLNNILGQIEALPGQLEQQYGIQGKMDSYNKAKNEYDAIKEQYRVQAERIRTTAGQTAGQVQADLNELARKEAFQTGTLAIEYAARQGDYQGAQQLMDKRLALQLEPLKMKYDFYKDLYMKTEDQRFARQMKEADRAYQTQMAIGSLDNQAQLLGINPKILATNDYKTVSALIPAVKAITDYQNAVKKWGSYEKLSAEGSGELKSAYGDAIAAWKTLAGLGALSGADFGLAENTIPSPSLFTRNKKVETQLTGALNRASFNVNNIAQNLKRAYPESAGGIDSIVSMSLNAGEQTNDPLGLGFGESDNSFMDTTTFAQKIKQKYPQYQNVNDADLVSKIVEKYPQYKTQISDLPKPESFGKKVADVFTGSTQAFGKTAGEVLAAKKNTEDFSKAAKQSSDLELALVQKIADNKKIGQDTAKLESTLADLQASRPKLENFTGVEDITNKQVIGQAIGTALEATSGGLLEGGAKNALSRTASLLEKIKSGAKVGSAYGATGGLSQGLQQNKDAMGIAGDVATGAAIGGALGGGLPAVGTLASAGTKQAGKVVGEVATQAGKVSRGASKIAGDIIPTKREFMSGQISKALDLTAGDLSNIKLGTGNDVGDFIARNNLIGGSKEETIAAVKKLTDSQYKLVRDEIAKVPNVYSVKDIPKVKQSLSLLEKQVKDVPGLEDTYKQVKALSKKTSIELKDVQKVKELLDDQFSLFKMTGDVKDGTIKKGLANVRKNIKEFIETEVKNTTGADIAQLNNDVSTGKSIMKLAEKRSTRDFTRANVSLSDLGAFGGGSMIGTPLFGAAAVAVKRIAETPTARLYLAKLINSLPKATQKAVQEELLNGKVPKVIKDTISDYRLATNIKNSSTTIAKKASIRQASTKMNEKSK